MHTNQSKIYFTFIVMLFLLVACASTPTLETLNRRVALFEVSYEQALLTVDRWIEDGRLNGDKKQRVQRYIKDIYKTRLSMYVALKAGGLDKAMDNLNTSLIALDLVRKYIPNQATLQKASAREIKTSKEVTHDEDEDE